MDLVLEAGVAGLIERARLRHRLGCGCAAWRAGDRLKLLVYGYCGARNTGSDARAEGLIRQLRHVLGAANVEFTVVTLDKKLTRGYFPGSRQVEFPLTRSHAALLDREVPRHHGVIVCDGPTFSSVFGNLFLMGALAAMGVASAHGKLSVVYGCDRGPLDFPLPWLCRRYCGQTLALARSGRAHEELGKLGIPTRRGTDPAWVFEPLGQGYGERALRDAGWDGASPVLAVCPMNAFSWPVTASPGKALARALTGAYAGSHYGHVYFHRGGAAVDAAHGRYVRALGGAVRAFRARRKVFPVVVGMERRDEPACRAVAEALGGAPVFGSARHDARRLVSILRRASLLVSSRFHALVTSMPGLVPSAGVSHDERIPTLLAERGHGHLDARADDPQLEARLAAVMETLHADREAVRDAIGRAVARELRLQAGMGRFFEEELLRRCPGFPVRAGAFEPRDYLPPLDPVLRALVAAYGG